MAFHLAFGLALSLALFGAPYHWQQGGGHSNSYSQENRNSAKSGGQDRYYASREAMDYKDADRNCKDLYGNDYGLAEITSPEDQVELMNFLSASYGPRINWWIGGTYSEEQETYIWSNIREGDGFQAFRPFLLNIVKDDPTTRNLNTRTAFYQVNQLNTTKSSEIHAFQYTETLKFVCELRKGRVPDPCQVKSDIAVVLDSSGSIGASNYQLAKNSAAELIRSFAAKKDSRQLGIVYSDSVKIQVPLDFVGTPTQKFDMMMKAPYLASITNTGKAIQVATQELVGLSRPPVKQAMVVITDGGSTDSALLAESVPAAKEAGIRLLAVGVGNQLNKTELAFISSPYPYFHADDWESLQAKLNQIAAEMCPPQNTQRASRG